MNCGTLLVPQAEYCHTCGQDTANHPPSLFEFVHEFITHYVALEGTLWRSLKALALRPGFLTVEYLAGRKARYVLPLRLLLTLGFVFFLLVKLIPNSSEDESAAAEIGEVVREEVGASAPSAASASASATFKVGGGEVVLGGGDLSQTKPQGDVQPTNGSFEVTDPPDWLAPQLDAAQQRWDKDSTAEFERIKAKVRGLMPYAVLCSLPFFAGILALVFWWRRYAYGAHFVFAMHLHAFFYLALSVLAIVPFAPLEWATIAWLVIYPLLAIKRVYAKTWWAAIGSSAVVCVLHAILQLVMLVAVLAIGALAP